MALPLSYQAVVVTPGQSRSARVVRRPLSPPGPDQLVLQIVRVGICGTDAEIDSGLYGEAPAGAAELVIGHESLTQVAAMGSRVSGWQVGQWAVPIVRRPCPGPCPACQAGRWDFCVTGQYQEHGIKGLDGFLGEYAVIPADAAVPLPSSLADEGVLVEPLTIVEKALEEGLQCYQRSLLRPQRGLVTGAGPVGVLAALLMRQRGMEVWALDRRPADSPKAQLLTQVGCHYIDDGQTPLEQAGPTEGYDLVIEATGYSPLLFRAANVLGKNGVIVLTGVTSGHHTMTVDSDVLNARMVLENQIMIGSVNAARHHYLLAIRDLVDWSDRWPGLAASLITARHPLQNFREALNKNPDDIKTVVEVQ